MKQTFQLVKVFSVTSCLIIVTFMLVLSFVLGIQLENQLLERDRIITVATVRAEAMEYIGNLPFEHFFQNEGIKREVLEVTMNIPGALRLEMIDTKGEILWSSDGEDLGDEEDDEAFRQALKGKGSVEKEGDVFSIYIPLLRNGSVFGVFELYRENERLEDQVEELKESIYLYCFIFGIILYAALMSIIFPASRIIKTQYRKLISIAESLTQANASLHEAQEKLVHQERLSAIGEVCGAVAHGLKNPIASVRSAVQLLVVGGLSAEGKEEIVGDILDEVDRLTKRLNDMLNFIRPFDPDPQYTQLEEVLQNAVRGLTWKANEDKIQLEVLPHADMESISIDATLIEESLLIVLSNAMDASAAGSTIRCQVETAEAGQIITIEDEGKGIAPEVLPKVFEQFFTTRSRGVGLGLALCKKIMELHHGNVSIESELGKGTTVQLFFPTSHS